MRRLAARSRYRVVPVVLCGLLALAGCDGADDEGANGAQSEVAANARAAAINVNLSDLPEGYAAIPAPEDQPEENPAAIEGCVDEIDDVTAADASSPTFHLQSDAALRFVASDTSILSDPDAGERLLDAVQEQPVLDCVSDRLGELFAELLPETTAETPLGLVPDPEFSATAGSSVRLAGDATFARGDGQPPITVNTSLVFLHTGDVLSVLLVGGVAEPFPPETLRSLATAVAERQAGT